MKNQFAFLLAVLLTASCNTPVTPDDPDKPSGGGETPENPTPGPGQPAEQGLPSVSTFKLGESFSIPFGEPLTMPYKGFSKGDKITLTSRPDPSVRFELECTDVSDEKGATFTTPSHFIGGMCTLECPRFQGGVTFVEVVDGTVVEKVPGKTTYGRVVDWDGKPLKGVAVSDGVMVTVTDDNGTYHLASQRKYGYVFISVPGGYRVAVNRTIPQFFKRFRSASYTEYEINNFVLEPEANSTHRIVAFTDTHLANRTNDISQFTSVFKPDLKALADKARAEGVPFYGLTLGDLAWDQFWYDNQYSLENYYKTLSDLDIPVYNAPGNHDNDPYVANDFGAEAAFRKWIGPTYYSFNIGDVHYILMDNTVFNNKGGAQGVIGDVQDYTEGFSNDEMKWLRADLALVPAGSTVFFGTHIQYSNRPSLKTGGEFDYTYAMPAQFRTELVDLFAPFKVHYLSGHTHIAYTNEFSDKLMEHNIAAVCGTWWWTGYYTSGKCNICRDGTPQGSKVFDISGDDVKWRWKPMGHDENYQFRVYDLNNCLISKSLYCKSGTKISDAFFSEYVHGYDTQRSDNKLLVNVFDYDDKWTVSASEGGKPLVVRRVETYDPLHVVHFNTRRMNTNSTSMTFPTVLTSHMFEVDSPTSDGSVTITVTDRFGRQYAETVSRPRKLYDMTTSTKY